MATLQPQRQPAGSIRQRRAGQCRDPICWCTACEVPVYRSRVASVTVFVDDAVRGHLPAVCARTGVPTSSRLTVRAPVGGLGAAAWLLLLLGPVGWLVLLFLAVVGGGREEVTVRIPYSERAIAEEQPWRRGRLATGVAGAAAIVLAILHPVWPSTTWLLAALVMLVGSFIAHSVLYFRAVDVSLDGSRRWVTLSHVHPAFAHAVAASVDESRRRQGSTDTS